MLYTGTRTTNETQAINSIDQLSQTVRFLLHTGTGTTNKTRAINSNEQLSQKLKVRDEQL